MDWHTPSPYERVRSAALIAPPSEKRDLVVADTAADATYFATRFGLPSERVAVCYVGAEDRLFNPGRRSAEPFRALFVGKLIPLHGIETILSAAALCPDVAFLVVGSGQLSNKLPNRPDNVQWEPWVDYERLPDLYRAAGCALGIFGTSEKARRVIPNKAFHALATETPLITADTEASRELLRHEFDALLVPVGDPASLADAVRRLASDPAYAREIGRRGRATYVTHASEEVLGRRWRTLLSDLEGKRSTRTSTHSVRTSFQAADATTATSSLGRAISSRDGEADHHT